MRAYISGPITGTHNAKERFEKAAVKFERLGYDVVNPQKVDDVLLEGTWEEYMKIDLALLSMCDVIVLLEGWQNSKGCMMEKGYAMGAGMGILYDEDIKNE